MVEGDYENILTTNISQSTIYSYIDHCTCQHTDIWKGTQILGTVRHICLPTCPDTFAPSYLASATSGAGAVADEHELGFANVQAQMVLKRPIANGIHIILKGNEVSGVVMGLYNKTSSANINSLALRDREQHDRSLKINKGPNIEPWGTPERTGSQEEHWPLRVTLWNC